MQTPEKKNREIQFITHPCNPLRNAELVTLMD